MKLKFVVRVVYILLISVAFRNVAKAQALQIIPDAIVFNNDLTGHSDDAITIRDEDGDPYAFEEYYVYEGNRNNPFAYVIGMDSITIEVMFSDISTNEYDGMAHLILELSYISTYGIGSVCGLFIPNYDFSTADYREIRFESELPNFVMNDDDFTWNWKIYAIPINAGSGVEAGWKTSTTMHNYYTLLAEPQAPMSEPWVSVLDYACEWASGETTLNGAATKVTESLYSSGFVYEKDKGEAKYGGSTVFQLGTFISDIGFQRRVNCLDMAKAVTTFANSLGCSLSVTRFEGNWFRFFWIDRYGFLVNLIDPIGINDSTPPTNNVLDTLLLGDDCRQGYFKYHAFAQDNAYNTWDAC